MGHEHDDPSSGCVEDGRRSDGMDRMEDDRERGARGSFRGISFLSRQIDLVPLLSWWDRVRDALSRRRDFEQGRLRRPVIRKLIIYSQITVYFSFS